MWGRTKSERCLEDSLLDGKQYKQYRPAWESAAAVAIEDGAGLAGGSTAFTCVAHAVGLNAAVCELCLIVPLSPPLACLQACAALL